MLDSEGFDRWADRYDAAVAECDAAGKYPFAGYAEVLDRIYRIVTGGADAGTHPDVLDLGFGTAALTSRLYDSGCWIYGQDFSGRMVEIAKEKMPGAELYKGNFLKGLAEPLTGRKYDYIIVTYALHHMSDAEKAEILGCMRGLLKDGGKILTGDILFETREAIDLCRADAGDEWDEDEIYIVAGEMKKIFPRAEFEKISFCAGVLTIPRD